MLDNRKVISRRLVLSAKQLYLFQQTKVCTSKQVNDDLKDENEESKVYVLGYN